MVHSPRDRRQGGVQVVIVGRPMTSRTVAELLEIRLDVSD